jgi:hypothetical protein
MQYVVFVEQILKAVHRSKYWYEAQNFNVIFTVCHFSMYTYYEQLTTLLPMFLLYAFRRFLYAIIRSLSTHTVPCTSQAFHYTPWPCKFLKILANQNSNTRWPGLFVCKQVTVCPGHIWTTLYIYLFVLDFMTYLPYMAKKGRGSHSWRIPSNARRKNRINQLQTF